MLQTPVTGRPEPSMLFQAGANHRTVHTDNANVLNVSLLFPPPARPVSTLAWPVLLIPEVVDSGYGMGDGALHLYQLVEFDRHVPDVFEAEVSTQWVHTRGDEAEIGVQTVARQDGVQLARSVTVSRVANPGAAAHDFGQPAVPALPVFTPEREGGSFMISREKAEAFGRATHTSYALHENAQYAQHSGFPNSLVQGHVIVLEVLPRAGLAAGGRAEAWFLRPVPAGAVVSLRSAVDGEDTLWSLHVAGNDKPAVVLRTRRGVVNQTVV